MDNRFCRFRTKVCVSGQTIQQGRMSPVGIGVFLNQVLNDHGFPEIALGKLSQVRKGYHVHFDGVVNGVLIAYEIEAMEEPVGFEPS